MILAGSVDFGRSSYWCWAVRSDSSEGSRTDCLKLNLQVFLLNWHGRTEIRAASDSKATCLC